MESPRVAGDVFYVSHQHAESAASTYTVTSPGNAANPQIVLCVNDGAEPPTTPATTATVSTTGLNVITLLGHAVFDGITFSSGTGTGNVALVIGGQVGSNGPGLIFRNCGLRLGSTHTSARIRFFGTSLTGLDGHIELVNTTVQFANANQAIVVYGGRLYWKDTPGILTGANVPGIFFQGTNTGGAIIEMSGLDLSAIGSGNALFNVASNNPNRFYIRNCKFNGSVSLVNGSFVSNGGIEVFFDNCDSGAVNYRMAHHKFAGTILHETTVVKSGGASDGTTPLSWKMTSATNAKFFWPLVSPPIAFWNELTGSPITLSVDVLHDSLTALKDNEIWLDVEYPASAADPRSAYANDRSAHYLATAADQDSSLATWTTTGLTNPNKQKLSVTFTPAMKGVIRAQVMLGKASTTAYVDPVLVLG